MAAPRRSALSAAAVTSRAVRVRPAPCQERTSPIVVVDMSAQVRLPCDRTIATNRFVTPGAVSIMTVESAMPGTRAPSVHVARGPSTTAATADSNRSSKVVAAVWLVVMGRRVNSMLVTGENANAGRSRLPISKRSPGRSTSKAAKTCPMSIARDRSVGSGPVGSRSGSGRAFGPGVRAGRPATVASRFMTAMPSPLYSWSEYLAWESRYPDTKWELHGGVITAMTGGSVPHASAIAELTALLVPAAKAHGCRAYASDVRLRINGSWSFYPDLGVYCDPEDDDVQFRERPGLLVEVASPSTRRIDRTEKLAVYTGLPSLEAYLVVEPEHLTITVFRRDAGWSPEVYGPGETIELPCPPITVEVSGVFS